MPEPDEGCTNREPLGESVSLTEHLPDKATDMLDWQWPDFEPYYREVARQRLTADTVAQFLTDWTRVHDRASEVNARLQVAKWRNTADKEVERRFDRFLEEVRPQWDDAEQQLRTKLLESGLQPAGFELPVRKMRTDAALFRKENIPLEVEEKRLYKEYEQLITDETVIWEGKETALRELDPVLSGPDRARREAAWRVVTAQDLKGRQATNSLWRRLLDVRVKLAANAGCRDYREYGWQLLKRFDYTPEHCRQFHQAVEKVVVPAAVRVRERRRRMLGLDVLRPWDLGVDVLSRPPLRPFSGVAELKSRATRLFSCIDEDVGSYFQTMINEDLLDLEVRKHKTPYTCFVPFDAAQRPFIMMSGSGTQGDLMDLVHEFGHSCHVFEKSRLPWFQQRATGYEIEEMASQSMELLASAHLGQTQGGFYTEDEARRAVTEHLESILLFLPQVATVDALQHWAYENPKDAADPQNLDGCWRDLKRRFAPDVDWTGLEDVLETGWWREQSHILVDPLYYIDYGVAMVGACQIWADSLRHQAATVAAYRRALALGGTRSLPELYAAAGVKFAFDVEALVEVVALIETQIPE